jgi:TM2 domain-containing membrane protein YozV
MGNNKKPQRKEPALAGVLSFLFFGVGQIYNGNVRRGVIILISEIILFILSIVILSFGLAWVSENQQELGPAGIFAIIIGALSFLSYFIVWIWNIFDAVNGAKKINQSIDKEEEQQKDKAMKVDGFIETLRKNYLLFKEGVLSEEEFKMRKEILLSQLKTKNLDKDLEDFLYLIMPLKKEGILTDEDLKTVKQIIAFKSSKSI